MVIKNGKGEGEINRMSEKVKVKKKVTWLKYFKEIKIKLRLRKQNRWGFQGLSVNTRKFFTCEAKWKKN